MIGPEVTADTPDLFEEVLAFRTFALIRDERSHNFVLASPYAGDKWDSPNKTAKCDLPVARSEIQQKIVEGITPRSHAAPEKDCRCGIYAYFDPAKVRCRKRDLDWYMYGSGSPHTQVPAVVALSGRLEVHDGGIRAQRGRIVVLGTGEWLGEAERKGLAALAERWEVELVPQEQLVSSAGRYGTFLKDPASFAKPQKRSVADPTESRELPKRQRWTRRHRTIIAMQGAPQLVVATVFAFTGTVAWISVAIVLVCALALLDSLRAA